MFRVFACGALVAASMVLGGPASAQEPLRIIIGFPAGAGVDIMGRIMADHMKNTLNRPVLVENKPGAGGILGNETVKVAGPGGNMLLLTPLATMVAYPHSYTKLPYDPFKDFAPVAHVANIQLAFAVGAKVPAKTLAEYGAIARQGGNNANFGSPGAGSLPHFFGVLYSKTAGFNLVHVPYRGTAPVIQALQGDEIVAAILPIGDFGEPAKAGHVRILAASGPTRAVGYENIPTFRESGFNLDAVSWFAMYAPANTPANTLATLSRAVIAAIKDPEAGKKIAATGVEPTGLPPEELARIHKADYDKWGPPIRESGFKADQ
jgi:tripartite-type tricarboxylate transporter receptor subunit TctC